MRADARPPRAELATPPVLDQGRSCPRYRSVLPFRGIPGPSTRDWSPTVYFRNESTFDRSVCIVAGLGLITLAFVGPQSP